MNALEFFLLIIGLYCFCVITIRIKQAIKIANKLRPYNPPSQLYVKDNQWQTKPGSQKRAWLRTFQKELKGL